VRLGQHGSPSGSAAFGGAAATINLVDDSFAVTVAAQGIQPSEVLSAEIHLGHRGETGPTIFGLSGQWQAVTPDVSALVIQGYFPPQYVPDLLAGGTYVQVNTFSFPQGAVRGQLIAPTAAT
jgi:CHRD domain